MLTLKGEPTLLDGLQSMAARRWLVLAKFGSGLIAFAVLMAMVVLAICATVTPRLMGWDTVAISSGSMEPSLEIGDVLVAEAYHGQKLDPNMILVVRDPTRPGFVSHRLQSVNADGTVTIKGDNNRGADSTPIALRDVVGIGRMVVPIVGSLSLWAQSGNVLGLLTMAAVLLVLLFAARWGVLTRFDPWPPERSIAPDRTVGPTGGRNSELIGLCDAWAALASAQIRECLAIPADACELVPTEG